MHPPDLPLYVWWVTAIAATFTFLAFFVPGMPNRRYKVQLSLAPFAAVLLVAVSAVVKHHNAEVSLPLYVSVLLGVPLGLAGRRKELRGKALDIAANGYNRDNALSKAAQVQAFVAILIVGGAGAWFSMAG